VTHEKVACVRAAGELERIAACLHMRTPDPSTSRKPSLAGRRVRMSSAPPTPWMACASVVRPLKPHVGLMCAARFLRTTFSAGTIVD